MLISTTTTKTKVVAKVTCDLKILFLCPAGCVEMGCTTTSGPDPNKPCIFPFKLYGNTYECCTTALNDPGNTDAWCSTMVDNWGGHIGGQGKWGTCESKCQPKDDGRLTSTVVCK